MGIELRWYRLKLPPFDRILQFRETKEDECYYGEWQDVPMEDQHDPTV